MPSSRGSSQPMVKTHVSFGSCIGRQILYHGNTWEAPECIYTYPKNSHLHSHHHHEPLKSYMAENKSHHIKALKMCLLELKDGPSTLAIDFITLNFIFIP